MAGPGFVTLDGKRFLRALGDPRWRLTLPVFGSMRVSPSWAFPPRALVDHMLYLLHEGSCELAIGDNGRRVTLQAGDLFLLSPGVVQQSWLTPGRAPMSLRWTRFDLRRGHQRARQHEDMIHLPGATDLDPYLHQIVLEATDPQPLGGHRIRGLLLAMMSAVLRRHRLEKSARSRGPTLTPAQRRTLIDFADAHIAERPSPEKLADLLRLSPDYFTRVFRRSFGQPPRQWLVHHRMRHAAARLAESNLNITEIALSLGYEDLYLFSRQFKQALGRSPRDYRRSLER